MDKQKLGTIAYFGMIIIVILTCIFLVFYLRSNAQQCLADPLEYYTKKTMQQCFCVQDFGMIP